jgi:acetyltransferase-like isoleucine patch superfamily enzyme
MLNSLKRFLGMNAPLKSIRIAMYRKAGIRIGKVLEFGSNVWIDINFKNLVTIGDNVIIAGHIIILSHSFIMQEYKYEGFRPVIIKSGARIGVHCVILPGVTIGENSVIGAGAVVTSDIPPNCLAVGIPAKPVRTDLISVRQTKEPPVIPSGLYVKCKTCGVEFWSAISCDKKAFSSLNFKGNCHPCPNGHADSYSQKDYYFRD